MPTPTQNVAALIIMNGYRIAPYVTPCASGYALPCKRETQAFTQLAAYMGSFKELETSFAAWGPFELLSDANGPPRVALASWLRGGARYLQSLLLASGIDAPAPEHVPIDRWFGGIQALADCLAEQTDGQMTANSLRKVRTIWDRDYQHNSKHDKFLNQYYAEVEKALDQSGLESNAQRIVYLRRKNRIASIDHLG